MEFAAAALTSIASAVGGGGAAAGAAGAAAGAAGAAGSGFSLLSAGSLVAGILSGSASLVQMAQLREAGKDKELSLNLQAEDTKTDIGAENVKAAERRSSLKRSLLQTIGERDAAVAASGVDLTFGTPAIIRSEAVDDAESTLATDDLTTGSRISRLNERAANLRLMARQARKSADAQADIVGIGAAASLFRRG